MSKHTLFTQKHYEHLMAEVRSYPTNALIRCEVAAFLCGVFESDNPKFKRQMFLDGALAPKEKETGNV